MTNKKNINKSNAGGSATNSGIDYQQRVGAWFLISQYTNFQINRSIDLEKELFIESIHFETTDSIDDLKIICNDNNIIFFQVKRCISSLSDSKKSDFYKTLQQFVNDFIKNYSEKNYYVLVTTSDSTSTIKKDFKKILSSIRLNDSSFALNPLNSSEKTTLQRFRALFYNIYKEITGSATDELHFFKFCKQVFISIIDLEEGTSNVNAALVLLKSANFDKPELIWKLLITNCLSFAAKRQSVNKSYITTLLNQFTTINSDISGINIETEGSNSISLGKDIVIIESFVEDADFLICELFRFDDFGMPKLKYRDDKLIVSSPEKEDDDWNIIYRCSTLSGLERYLEENKHIFENKKLFSIPADESIDHVEKLENIIALKEKYSKELALNLEIGNCLHCGKSISSEKALIIEVDELGFKHTFGLIHKRCHRPLNRVLGITMLQEPLSQSYLKNFDYNKWASLITRGQGQINAVKNNNNGGKIPVISYNAESEINDGDFCIRLTLEDKSFSYMYCGHEIERYHKDEGEDMLNHLKNKFIEAEKAKDPIHVTSVNYNYGSYGELTKRKKKNEKLIKVTNYELIRYSALISKIHETIDFDYAPICLVYDKDSGTIINFDNHIPFISDPLNFDLFYDNWIQSGYKLNDCELKIIDNDKDFGIHLMSFFDKGVIPIVDPEFDLKKNVINGYRIINFHDLVSQSENNEIDSIGGKGNFQTVLNPNFNKGDKVKVVIPNSKQDKDAIGYLLENELENENGERYVLFQPIEDGAVLELMFAIPSNIIERI